MTIMKFADNQVEDTWAPCLGKKVDPVRRGGIIKGGGLNHLAMVGKYTARGFTCIDHGDWIEILG
jgi:hypothetical protein